MPHLGVLLELEVLCFGHGAFSSGPPREVAQLGQDSGPPREVRSGPEGAVQTKTVLLGQDRGDFGNLLEHLRSEYAVFKPKHLRLFLPDTASLEPLLEGAFWEKRYLAAPLEHLRESALPDALEARPLSKDFYPRYLETYRELQERWLEHAEYAGVQEESDFLETDGAALELFLDGQYAGLVAASRAVEQGLRGFVVDEVVLSQMARGRLLGPVALRHLAEHLPALEGDVLFGTVDVRNTPAYRSALRSGREDVGGYLWVSLEG